MLDIPTSASFLAPTAASTPPQTVDSTAATVGINSLRPCTWTYTNLVLYSLAVVSLCLFGVAAGLYSAADDNRVHPGILLCGMAGALCMATSVCMCFCGCGTTSLTFVLDPLYVSWQGYRGLCGGKSEVSGRVPTDEVVTFDVFKEYTGDGKTSKWRYWLALRQQGEERKTTKFTEGFAESVVIRWAGALNAALDGYRHCASGGKGA